MDDMARAHKIQLNHDQIAAMEIPNTRHSLHCFGWMDRYFHNVGDCPPNSDGELHLEPITQEEIHLEYCMDMESIANDYVSLSLFRKIWKACFPFVKIRKHKAVCLKCDICAKISSARRGRQDFKSRNYLRKLHALHRSTYMGERISYYKRRTKAEMDPDDYLSIISDGMQQAHCELPWMGNLSKKCEAIPHHIQGVIVHGRKINMFRTFHNLSNNSNVQIHTLLSTLEEIKNSCDGKKLPETIFIQIDGGAENASK
jgi:hypothetical protein